jgi:hypothetical protein
VVTGKVEKEGSVVLLSFKVSGGGLQLRGSGSRNHFTPLAVSSCLQALAETTEEQKSGKEQEQMEMVALPHSGPTQVTSGWSVLPQAFLQQAAQEPATQDTPADGREAARKEGREAGGQKRWN